MANAKPSLVAETFTGSAAKYVLFGEYQTHFRQIVIL